MSPLQHYRKLHDGLSNMIESGRLTEAKIPDDYLWLVDSLAKIAGLDTESETPELVSESLSFEAVLTDAEIGQRTLDELMDSLLVTCIEGGSAHWCAGITLNERSEPPVPAAHGEKAGMPWYTVAFRARASMVVSEDEGGYHVLDREEGLKGLHILANRMPHQFQALMASKGASDAEVADCWLQCAVLGEVVYG